jgi:hypothetical protein
MRVEFTRMRIEPTRVYVELTRITVLNQFIKSFVFPLLGPESNF